MNTKSQKTFSREDTKKSKKKREYFDRCVITNEIDKTDLSTFDRIKSSFDFFASSRDVFLCFLWIISIDHTEASTLKEPHSKYVYKFYGCCDAQSRLRLRDEEKGSCLRVQATSTGWFHADPDGSAAFTR
jgi:hypothetical protein